MERKELNLADVPEDWFASAEGEIWLRREKLKAGWVEFLSKFGFDCWFTLTFRSPAQSAMLAIDRAVRALRHMTKFLQMPGLDAFIVAEQHHNGSYHCHGMIGLHALDETMARKMLSVFWKISFDMFGLNRFSLIRNPEAVQTYVSKYLTKQPADHRFVKLWRENDHRK